MVRYSKTLVVIVCLVLWTLLKTGYDILNVHKNDATGKDNSEMDAEEAHGEDGMTIHHKKENVKQYGTQRMATTLPSKSRIRRRNTAETENITLAKDRRLKEAITKYISITEGEAEMRELDSEINRLFYGVGSEVEADLERILTHMKENHPPPADHYYGHDVTETNQKPVNRKLPDNRPKYCKEIKYNITALPKVSVITPFHNEALTMLLRHIHSLINNSPEQLLTEIILVDDLSTLENLGPDLEKYFTKLDGRIRLVRNKERQGVSRSRMVGADMAKEDVLIFLDSHMECTPGWLEPILSRLTIQPNAVLQPVLPHIHSVENLYDEHPMRGAFDWDLSYVWSPYPAYMKSSFTHGQPVSSPTLTGCAIAVLRPFFYYLGGFDPGMEIWGGEHFELSFRAWMCRGRVETITCSIVGHLYKMLTYDFKGDPGTVKTKNNMRVAEVWMDEYKEIIYAGLKSKQQELPEFSEKEWKSIEKRKELRKKLKCGTFQNYLKMFPELTVPSKEHVYFGAVQNKKTSYCLVVHSNGYVGVGDRVCGDWRLLPEEQFIIDKWGRLMFDDVCVSTEGKSARLTANRANCIASLKTSLKWDLNPGPAVGRLEVSDSSGTYCVVHDQSDNTIWKQGTVKVIHCNSTHQQLWSFAYKFDFGLRSIF